MATPEKHALLGASSSHRWLNCTAAPRFEEKFPGGGSSVYADEGVLAHAFCELEVQHRMKLISTQKYSPNVKKLQKERLYQEEMRRTAAFYADYIFEQSLNIQGEPYVKTEVLVDYSDYAPEAFGTCDCIMIGGSDLYVFDYKHGKGVRVSAEGNTQMRLYALGAIARYALIYPIKTVHMAIVQPRITEDVSTDVIGVDDLRKWGEEYVKPRAQAAFAGLGTFAAGDWCRFCRGKALCKARADMYSALNDFKDIPIQGRLAADAPTQSNVLTDTQVAELLHMAEGLEHWVGDLKAYATEAILAGKSIPGWQLVEGRSNRKFANTDEAFKALTEAGFDEAMLYERKPKTIAQVEKVVGKKALEQVCAGLIVRPPGKPTLTGADDPRPAYNAAVADFATISS